MSTIQSEKPKLLIVSDTAVTKSTTQVLAFEPVVREIEALAHLFKSITWMVYRHPSPEARKSLRVPNVVIDFIVLERVGGRTVGAKLYALLKAPQYFLKVLMATRKASVVHSRAPSLPAFFAIIISLFDRKRVYWHKFAGDWGGNKLPYFYSLQRSLLKIAKKSVVTINGKFSNQPLHIRSFENPCITKEELETGAEIGNEKKFTEPLTLLFVGRLSKEKGVDILLEMLANVGVQKRIKELVLVGEGDEKWYKTMSAQLPFSVYFVGGLLRNQLNEWYAKAHILILPSKSEGFPKVVAEAAAYGCVPVVSDVFAISQYIDKSNGLLFSTLDPIEMAKEFETLISNTIVLKERSVNILKMTYSFTYANYIRRVHNEILLK